MSKETILYNEPSQPMVTCHGFVDFKPAPSGRPLSNWRDLAVMLVHFSPSGSYRLALDQIIEDRFEKMATEWKRETVLLSSPSQICAHPIFSRLVAFGERAAPWVLERIAEDASPWFLLLKQIVVSPPDLKQAEGDIKKVRKIWLKWGKERGYC